MIDSAPWDLSFTFTLAYGEDPYDGSNWQIIDVVSGGGYPALDAVDFFTYDNYHYEVTFSTQDENDDTFVTREWVWDSMEGDDSGVVYVDGETYLFCYPEQYSGDGTVQVTAIEVREVPLPTSVILFGTGMLGLAGIRRKRVKP